MSKFEPLDIEKPEGRIERKLQKVVLNTSKKEFQKNYYEVTRKSWKFLIFNYFIKILSSFVSFIVITLLIVGPITNNYYEIINNKKASLDYKINLNSFKLVDSGSKIEIRYSSSTDVPNPHYSYHFGLKAKINVLSGEVSSAYLVYTDYNQKISESAFHNLNFSIRENSSFLDRIKISSNKYADFLFPNSKYLSTINFKEEIFYSRGASQSIENPFEPLYLVLVDDNNNVSINVILADGKPQTISNSSATSVTAPGLPLNINSSPTLDFYTSKNILDSQDSDNPKSLPISGERFSKDSFEIQKIIKNYFIS